MRKLNATLVGQTAKIVAWKAEWHNVWQCDGFRSSWRLDRVQDSWTSYLVYHRKTAWVGEQGQQPSWWARWRMDRATRAAQRLRAAAATLTEAKATVWGSGEHQG